MSSLLKITSSVSFALMLSACGGGGGNGGGPGDPPDPADTQAPSLSITSPTSEARYDTDSVSITLAGEAGDNEGVVEVTWQCASGCSGSGSASGTTNWSTGNIDLAGGDNTIVVTATDAAGNTGSDSIAVSYAGAQNQPVSPVTDMDATPNSVDESAPTGTAVGITAHATDGDEGDAISYQLAADSSGGLFGIDPETGVVSLVNAGLDYETTPSHTITVVANSSDGTSSSANFTIAVIDNTTPVLSIAFPPEGALFDGDAITVKGTFAEAYSIEVSNGTGDLIAAQLDNAAGTWAARLPLGEATSGRVTFSVSAKGDDEAVTATRTVRTDTLIGDMGVVVFDEARNQLIVADNQYARLVRVNTKDWSQSVLSGNGVGDGENLSAIAGMVMDPATERVILTDSGRDVVVAVDVDNGNRKVISGGSVGTGTGLDDPAGLAMRGENILLVDKAAGAVIEIDATNGNRTVLSRLVDIGDGDALTSPTAIALTTPDDLSAAHVTTPSFDRLFAIDLETGDRTSYKNTSTQGANRFGNATQVAVADGRILVIDNAGNSVSSVNPLDGTRSTYSISFDGNGPDFQELRGIAFGLGNNGDPRLVATDAGVDKMFLLSSQGARRLMPVNAVGEGELIRDGDGQVEFDPVAARLYYRDQLSSVLYANLGIEIDVENGNRQWLYPEDLTSPLFASATDFAVDETSGRVFFTDGTSVRELADELPYRSSSEPGTTVGEGIAFQSAEWIFYNPDANESYIADVDSNALIRVDMATGDRFAVSDEETDSPFSLSRLHGDLVVDMAGGRVLAIASDNRLFATDLATGVRSSFASEGEPLEIFFSDIDLDRSHRRVIATTPYTKSIAAIDLVNQNRTLLSSADIGSGPAFVHPYRLSLDEKNQVAYVVDRDLAAVFAVDLQTGDRVILSK